ncbi:MAG: amidase family protein [Woeseiaceae bacterium]
MQRREFLSAVASGAFLAAVGCTRRNAAASAEDLVFLDAIDQAALVERGELSAVEVIEAAIARIERVNPQLNAVVTKAYDLAMARVQTGAAGGRFWGTPYLLKDLTPYKGVRYTRGSNLYRDAIADSHDAYVDKTEAAGLIVLGKTNTPEFGLISTTESVALGAAQNPWNTEHSTGGSSGGSAAAVAARMVPAAQSSDGGGSIRIPASQCGVFGLKPSRGRFPFRPATPTSWPISIRHAVSNSVRDSALILALTEQGEGATLPPIGFVSREEPPPLKIALSLKSGRGDLPHRGVASAVETAGELLEELGHDIVVTEQTPLADPAALDHFLVHWASWAVGIAADVENATGKPAGDTGLLEPWTIGLADHFRSKPADALPNAVREFRRSAQEVAGFFDRYDAWLTSVTASPAPRLGEQAPTVPFDTLLERVVRFAAYTPLHNVAGTPAMSVPFAKSVSGLPIGVQLSTRAGGEALLLKLAYQLEEARPWVGELPAVHA